MTLTANWSREGGEERTEDYRTWRTELGFGAVCDIDQIEYNYQTGKPTALVELCVADYTPTQPFLEALERKVGPERGQGRLLRYLAETLKVPVFLVSYTKGKLQDGVWWKLLGSDVPWKQMSLEEYKTRLNRWVRMSKGAKR